MTTLSTGLATSFITFSRPGASGGGATVTDRDGKIKWAGHNLLTNSESFDASAWNKGSFATVAANTEPAPNSTTTADTITTSNVGHAVSQAVSVTAGASYTFAFWAKRGTMTDAKYSVFDNTNAANIVAATSYYSSISASTWTLVTVSFTAPAGCAQVAVYVLRDSGVTGTMHLWGAHLYRSDLGGMQLNPAMPAGMQSYYPTSVANRLGYTETFSNAAWVGLNGGASAPTKGTVSGTKPNGLTGTIDTLTIPAVSAGQWSAIYQNAGATFANVPITFSVYARVSSGTATIYLNVEDIGAGPSAGNFIASTAKTLDSTWQRISVTGTRTSTTGNSIVVIGFDTRCGAGQTNASSITIELWGAQLSDSASLDTYVPVYGAAVTSAAYYAPRLDFDPVTLAARGLLVEEARTNLALQSNAFDTAANWITLNSTVSANAIASPDGTANAEKIAEDTATGSHGVYQSITLAANATYTLSVYAKSHERTKLNLFNNISSATATNLMDVTFDLSAGTASATHGTATITNVGGGWYRCTVTNTMGGTGGGSNFQFRINNGSGTSYAGSTGSGLYVYGAQLEAGSFATSYIPTGASTATRTADVASVSTQAFPYSASEGTWVANWSALAATSSARIIGTSLVSDATPLAISSSTAVASWSGATNLVSTAGSSTLGPVKAALGYSAAGRSLVHAGTSATTDSAVMPTQTQFYMGRGYDTSAYMNGHIRQITYLPRRLTSSELQSRTA